MESIYEIDQLISNLDLQNDDNTKTVNSTNTPTMMYNHKLHSDLYTIDIEMDYKNYDLKSNNKDVNALMDLYEIDQLVEYKMESKQEQNAKGTPFFNNEYECNIYKSLFQMDIRVDGSYQHDTYDTADFIDPITDLLTRRHHGMTTTLRNQEKCWTVYDIMDLFKTDQFIDNCTSHNHQGKQVDEGTGTVMNELYNVDCHVDEMTRVWNEKKEFENNIIDLYLIDQQVNAASTVKAVSKERTLSRSKRHGTKTTDNQHFITKHRGLDTLPNQIAELYLTDLDVEGRIYTIDEAKDIDIILDLNQVDREVDRTKYMAHRDESHDLIFKQLYYLDLVVDKQWKGDYNIVFEDNITRSLLKQYAFQMDTVKKQYSLADVFDLILTDLDVNGHNSYVDALNEIEPLLEIDLEMKAASDFGHSKDTMKDVLELLKVDIEIEVLKSAKDTIKTEHFMKGNISGKNMVKTSESSTNKAAMDVIIHLHAIDQEVSQAKYSAFFNTTDISIYQDLRAMDKVVDKVSMNESEEFKDPFTRFLLRQYEEEYKANSSNYDNGICDILELISNDMKVGAAVSHKKASAFEKDILALYEVDLGIEKRKLQLETQKVSIKVSNATKHHVNQQRSIFSQKVKELAKSATSMNSNNYFSQVSDGKISNVASFDSSSTQTSNLPSKQKRSIFSQKEKLSAAMADIFKRR